MIKRYYTLRIRDARKDSIIRQKKKKMKSVIQNYVWESRDTLVTGLKLETLKGRNYKK
jgi:NMD protein affecting ribosome stability and mRNA decay